MQAVEETNKVVWVDSVNTWIFILVIAALLGVTFYAGL